MMLSTCETIANHSISSTLGLVTGISSQSGRLSDLANVTGRSLSEAENKMIAAAQEIGANGIVGIVTTSTVSGVHVQTITRGTAVVLRPST